MADAVAKHKEADVIINFASLRSAEEATLDILKYPQGPFVILMPSLFSLHCITPTASIYFFDKF